MRDENESKFLSIKEVQSVFRISRGTERRWRNDGDLPQPVKLGKLILYRKSDIDKIVR